MRSSAICAFKALWMVSLFLSFLIAGEPTVNKAAVAKTQSESQAQATSQTININTADVKMLQTLPRIGPKIAQRVVSYREENGAFKAVEDIKKVRGIGEKTFEKLKPLISI